MIFYLSIWRSGKPYEEKEHFVSVENCSGFDYLFLENYAFNNREFVVYVGY